MKRQLSALILASALNACGGSSSSDEPANNATPTLPFTKMALSGETGGSLSSSVIIASDVPSAHANLLRGDLNFIEQWDGLMDESERLELRNLLGVEPTPAILSSWLRERLHYFLPSNIENYDLGLVFNARGQVGLQKLGPTSGDDDASTGASNIGAAIYSTTLSERESRPELAYMILRVDQQWVPVLSPRAGIVRIGPALFNQQYLVNRTNIGALSNSVQRLEVIFHEARHSDGNSTSGSLGFPHVLCPDDGSVPSELAGVPACDDAGNGAYTIGAAFFKAYMNACRTRCSITENRILQAIYLDRLSRVTGSAAMTSLDSTPETGFNALDIGDFGAFTLR